MLTRPFWYDEQWRAFHIARTGDGLIPASDGPMAAGWLAMEQAVGAVFGLDEFTLRAPSALALVLVGPATYLLGRWWLPRPAAAAAGALVTVNGSLLVYGLQLKPYLVETAATPLLVHLWLVADRARTARGAVLPAYLGMAALCLLSLPAVFVLAPLLLADALRARRSRWREAARTLAAPVLTGALAAAHLEVVLRRQSFLLHDDFWHSEWLGGPGQGLGQLGTYLTSFPWLGLLEPDGGATSPFAGSRFLVAPGIGWRVTVGLMLAALVVIGLRRRTGPAIRAFQVSSGGAFALLAVAAALHRWPGGAVRVNLFLLPLLALFVMTGAVELLSLTRGRTGPVLASLTVLGLAAVGLHWTVAARAGVHDPLLLGDLRRQQNLQRSAAHPGDVALVLTGRSEVAQWSTGARFYTDDYPWDGPGVAIPADATFTDDGYSPGAVTSWLAARSPSAVFLSTYNRVSDADFRGVLAELRADGWCINDRLAAARLTGQLTELGRC